MPTSVMRGSRKSRGPPMTEICAAGVRSSSIRYWKQVRKGPVRGLWQASLNDLQRTTMGSRGDLAINAHGANSLIQFRRSRHEACACFPSHVQVAPNRRVRAGRGRYRAPESAERLCWFVRRPFRKSCSIPSRAGVTLRSPTRGVPDERVLAVTPHTYSAFGAGCTGQRVRMNAPPR
jgi:hypothetical protein